MRTIRAAFMAAVASSAAFARAEPENGDFLADRFRYRSTSTNFEIASEQRIALDPLLGVAEATLARTREWLGVTGAPPAAGTTIYVTADAAGLLAIEREHGLDTPRSADPLDRRFRGRCFADAHVIVVPLDSTSLRWQVAHEVTHLVFHEIVGRNIEVVNEGLAELVPYWILCGAAGTPETIDSGYELYDRRLAQAALAREIPTFDAFLNVDEARFYDERANWLWYALSWKLSKVLVETRDPLIRGRFKEFLGALATGSPVIPALRSVYDARAVESAWLSELGSVAPWRPLFGDWRAEGTGLAGTVAGPHSASVISATTLFAGESFALEVALDGPPSRNVAFGFAFDVRDEDDFAYVEFRPGCSRIAIAEREAGRWVCVEDYPLDGAVRDTLMAAQRGLRVGLRASGRGRLDVLVEGTLAFRFELGRLLNGGSAGLMFENCDVGASERQAVEMRFGALTLTR
jgi:hypothetical protein